MSRTLKDTFPWHQQGLDRRGRIDRLFATLNDAELENQFRGWQWKKHRSTRGAVLCFFAMVVLLFIAVDLVIHGWTTGSIYSTAARGLVVLTVLTNVFLGRALLPTRKLYISTHLFAAACGACFTVEYAVRGIAWPELAVVALTTVNIFTLFMRQPLKQTLIDLALIVFPFSAAMLVSNPDLGDIGALVAILFGSGIAAHYMRHIALVSRDYFLQNNQLEQMAEELDENMKTMSLEHGAIQRAAEENAALADELVLARMNAEENAYYLENILENISQGVVVLDKDLRITKCNSAYAKLANLPPELAKVGTPITEVLRVALERGAYVDDRAREWVKNVLENPESLIITEPVVMERMMGANQYIEVRRNPLPGGGEVGTYTDITDRHRADELIRAQARHDPLTKLYNRHHYDEQLATAIARSRRTGRYVALAYLDLDHFKPINDTYGHPVGDEVLKLVASTMKAHVRDIDTVARLGGDEFAIIFDGIQVIDDIRIPIERIMHALTQPVRVSDIDLTLGISVGVAVYPLDAETPEKLGKIADRALYDAKQSGRGCWRLARSDYEAGLPEITGGAKTVSS